MRGAASFEGRVNRGLRGTDLTLTVFPVFSKLQRALATSPPDLVMLPPFLAKKVRTLTLRPTLIRERRRSVVYEVVIVGLGTLEELRGKTLACAGNARDTGFLNGVVLAGAHAGDAAAAAPLRPIGVQRQPLHVSMSGQRDHHILVRHQVLLGELLRLLVHDLRPEVIPEALLHRLGVVADEVIDLAGVGQQVLQISDLLDDLRVLILDLLALQAGQAAQLHVQHGLRLPIAELGRGLHQPLLRLFR